MPRDGTGPVPDNDRKDDGEDASRRRRALIALAVVAGLVVVSLYISHVLKRSGEIEDCQMQGRTNCEPIDSK